MAQAMNAAPSPAMDTGRLIEGLFHLVFLRELFADQPPERELESLSAPGPGRDRAIASVLEQYADLLKATPMDSAAATLARHAEALRGQRS